MCIRDSRRLTAAASATSTTIAAVSRRCMPIGAGNERDIIPAPRTRRPANSARLASLHAPRSPAMSIREVLRAHGAWAVLLAALVLPPYAHLLAGDEAALGRDYGKLFADVIEQH